VFSISEESRRAIQRARVALHDAITRVSGGSRILRGGEPIRPFGPKLAAEIIGRSETEVRNMADPNKPDHRFYADELHALLLEGMDPVWFEEVLRAAGIVCVRVPKIDDHSHIADEVCACIKEFGDVGDAIRKALDKQSSGGRRITRREMDTIDREIDEAVAELYALRDAAREEMNYPAKKAAG